MVIVDPRLTRPTIQTPGGSFGAQTHRASTSDTDTDGGGKGTYRTVCVRMCDGYYVPISFATPHKNIYQDQVKCRATCGDDARVFFKRNPLADEDPVEVYAGLGEAEQKYEDSYSSVDPEDADYARVLQLINEFLPVNEFAGRVVNVAVLRDFGLVENEHVDNFLAAALTKSEPATVFT